jgi:signal transduction histidine kinase/two-component SAPR family response regulator
MSTLSEKQKVEQLLKDAYETRVSNLHQSIRTAQQALEQSLSLGDQPLIAQCYNRLSLFNMIKGEYTLSVDMANEAIRIYEAVGDEKGLADSKYNIAGTYYKTDNYHLGLVYLIDCRHIYLKYKDYHNLSRTQKSLGTIYEYFGDIKNAEKAYEQAIWAAKEVSDYNLKSNAYNPLSGIQLKKGNVEEALRIIERSIELKQLTGDVRGLAFALYGRGKVYTATGKYELAEKDFHEAMAIHEQAGEKLGMGMAYHKLGCLYMAMDRTAEARSVLLKGVDFSAAHNIVITRFKCYYRLYLICKKEGQQEQALQYLEQYLQEKERVINTQTLQIIDNYELIKQMDESRLEREKAELKAQKEIAEHHAGVRRDFISAVSHELHTPLNGVMSIGRMLQPGVVPDEQMLHSLKRSAERLHHIISNMLDFSRLDSGEVSPELKELHLTAWLNQRISFFQPQAVERSVALQFDHKLPDAIYLADEAKLTTIADNLISNAIKFSPKGVVVVSAALVSGDSGKTRFRLSVADSGEGLTAQQREGLFTGFQFADDITTKSQEGVGLGLAIVKKLVELLKGTITVNPQSPHGTVFTIEIPLVQAAVPPPATEDHTHRLQNQHCLLAEDNDINAFVLCKLLRTWGVTADLAVNGELAVKMASEKKYGFILMDLHMPVMDGFEAARQIRSQNGLNSNTPVFAITADITAPSRTEFTCYFDEYLFKPLDFEKLERALTKAADTSK